MQSRGVARLKNWVAGEPLLFELAFRLMRKAYSEISAVRRLIRPDDLIFDVGASVGTYTSLFARLAGPRGAVHAFEPVPGTFERLVANVKANRLQDRVTFNQVALGEAEGVVEMRIPAGNFYEASTVAHRDGSWADGRAHTDVVRVEATTLDSYAARHAFTDVAFIKCDVEGAELPVFRGGRSLFQRTSPPILMFEMYPSWTADFGYTPRDLLDFLRGHARYEFFYCGPRGLQRVDPRGTIPAEYPQFLTFLAVVPDVHRDRIGGALPLHDTLV